VTRENRNKLVDQLARYNILVKQQQAYRKWTYMMQMGRASLYSA